MTVEYLTIEKFQPQGNGAAVNQDSNTGWTFRNNTITLNAPGAGLIAGADNTLKDNCLTLNGQYGFQSSDVSSWGQDSLTGGPYNVTVEHNEISYNDTCNFQGPLSNKAIGWSNYNTVPASYRNPRCGTVTPDGNEGGFKLWQTDGVTIKDNYIHNNWGPGAWVDTDNANTTFDGNTITANDGPAIIEEISYNFSITDNHMAYNAWAEGLSNPGFPTPAIYVSQSGSDTMFGGVPLARKRRARTRPRTASSPSSAGTPSSTTAETYSSGRTLTATARPASTMPARCWRRDLGAVHDVRLQVQPPVSVNQHDHVCTRACRVGFAGLVGRLHVVDGKRKGHREHHRLQPSGNPALQQDGLARLRRRRNFRGIQRAAALQPARGLGGTQPGTFFRGRYLAG